MSEDNNESRKRNPRKSKLTGDLKSLSEARKTGQVYRPDTAVQDVYDVVNEKEYNEIKNKRIQNNFIEGDDEDYYEDGEEMFYQTESKKSLSDAIGRKRSYTPQNSNIRKKKSKLCDDKKQSNLFSSHFAGTKRIESSSSSTVLSEEYMAKMLAAVDESHKPPKKEKQSHIVKSRFACEPKVSNFKIDQPYSTTTKVKTKEPVKLKQTEITSKPKDAGKVKNYIPNEIMKVHQETEPMEIAKLTENLKPTQKLHEDDFEIDDIDFDEPLNVEENEKKLKPEPSSKGIVSARENLFKREIEPNDAETMDTVDESSLNDVNVGDAKRFFWIDAYTDVKIPGCVFMFGKMLNKSKGNNNGSQFSSCCLKIMDLERRLYVLPKADVEYNDVYTEMRDVLNGHGITKFRCKTENKNYAFQLAHIPDNADYLMVQYDAKLPALPNNLIGRTFQHIFGINTSCLELLILDLKLKGPCWLDIKGSEETSSKFSTCTTNLLLRGIKTISHCDSNMTFIPPFKVMSLAIQTMTNSEKPDQQEIVAIGYCIHSHYAIDKPPPKNVFDEHFTLIAPPRECSLPYDLHKRLKMGQVGGAHYSPTTVITEQSERSLLNLFLARLQLLDPDVIVGHQLLQGHSLGHLLHRCRVLGVARTYRLGRLIRREDITGKGGHWMERSVTAGRVLVDTAVSARELVRLRNYEQRELVREMLPHASSLLANLACPDPAPHQFETCAQLATLLDATMGPAIANLHLLHALQVLPLALQITRICGNLLPRTLAAGKSERNEFLLLHAFSAKNYIVPDKDLTHTKHDLDEQQPDDAAKKKASSYLGGLVLEPKRGLYESFILLMDFNSLYPSIIQEFNICFTTLDRSSLENGDNGEKENEASHDNLLMTDDLVDLLKQVRLNTGKQMGILPAAIKNLVEARKLVKKQLANSPNMDPVKRQQLDIKQKALKITANSMYGCLGFTSSRFKAKNLAALITGYGRNILAGTKRLIESGAIRLPGNAASNNQPIRLNLDIVYGDTDSVMVNTGLSQDSDFGTVLEIGQRIKQEINRKHGNIELDIDGVFKKLLLLKKKKYAGLLVLGNDPHRTKQELKGLDIVRRDWCRLAVELGHEIVTLVLESRLEYDELVQEVRRRLGEVASRLRDSTPGGGSSALLAQVALEKFVITKSLTKNPESYSSVAGQPHVQVALRLNKAPGCQRHFRAKDTVEYVICRQLEVDGANSSSGNISASRPTSAMERAYAPQEVTASQKEESCLYIDTDYYLRSQIHPVISRLVECIEGLEPSVIADALGLDGQQYAASVITQSSHLHYSNHGHDQVTENARLAAIMPSHFRMECRHCKADKAIELSEPLRSVLAPPNRWSCPNCQKPVLQDEQDLIYMKHCLDESLANTMSMYYHGNVHCDGCGFVTRKNGNLRFLCEYNVQKAVYKCPVCEDGWLVTEYSAEQLYLQQKHLEHLFSCKGVTKRYYDAIQILHDGVKFYLNKNGYSKIDCRKMPFAHLIDQK